MADEPPPQAEISSAHASSAQDGSSERSWERAWTLDEMRKNSDRWTLAGDAGLLLYLQEFSQKMISRTHEIEKEVANLIHESKLTGVRVNNAFNDFMMLANTQFVENRVYVDDEEIQEKTASEETKPEDQEKTREQREAELIPKVNEAIQLGVNVIEEAFEKLDTNVDNTDSEDEDESYKVDPILEAKDPYVDRLLPYMIGSPNFMNDDDVGLKDISDEESDAGSISESESEDEDDEDEKKKEMDYSYSDSMSDTDNEAEKKPKKKFIESEEEDSDSEGDLFNDNKKESESDEETAESEVEGQDESETKTAAPEPLDFAAELAKKLGGGAAPPKAPSPIVGQENEEEDVPKQTDKHKKKKKKDKERKRSKSKSKERDEEDLFQPEKDNSDDDLFGGGMFAKKSGGLFDKDDESDEGDLFGDESTKKRAPSVKQSKQENHIDNDDEEDEEQPKEPERKRTASGKKIPAGGVSIFGDAGMKPSGGGGGGLFDDEEEEEDLFNSVSKPKSSSITEKRTEPVAAKTREPAGLFADDDEEDDLFSGKPAAPSMKASSKTDIKKPSLFDDDDDDDFTSSTKSEPKPVEEKKEPPKKKLPAGAVSMFGPSGANPLAAALKKQRPQSDEEEDDWSDGNKSRSESIKSNKSTASKSSTSSKPKSNSFSRNAKTTAGIFDDDEDDLFSTSKKQPTTKQLEKTKQQDEKPRSGSLFDDDEEEEEDLFGSKPAAKPKEQVKKPPAGAVSMFPGGIDPFGKKKQSEPELTKEEPKVEKKEEQKIEKKEKQSEKSTISLFGDDETEDSLFGSGDIKPPPIKKGSTPKSKSMFDDEKDDLFGSQQDDLFSKPPEPAKIKQPEPKVDTTTSVTKVTKPKATKPAGGVSLFGDEEEEEVDLFSKLPTPRKQTLDDDEVEDTKPIQKKPPVGGVSMFGPGAGALLPGLKKKEEKTEGPATKEEIKKEDAVPSVKKTAEPLFGGAEEEEDLFGGGPVKKQEVKPVKPTSLITPPPPLESSNFEDSDEDDLFGSGKKQEKKKTEEVEKPSSPVEVKPKKPVGGVSMFGGVNPFAERVKKSSETETQSSTSAGLSSPDDDLFDSQDQKQKVEAKKTEPPLQTETKSPAKGKIGKLQANLNFNPAAMLPGAAPPIKEPEPLNIGFDTPAEPRTLQSANKDRAKIQTKRRPPSRVARKRASAQSPDDADVFFSPGSPVSATSSTLSGDDGDSSRIPPPISDLPPRVPSPEPPVSNTQKTDMFGNDDLFGASPPRSTTKPVIDSKPAISEENDIFSSNSFGASKNKNSDNIDDLFAPPSVSAIKSESKMEQKDLLFNDTSKLANDTKEKNKAMVVDDNDDDLFSSPSLSKAKKKDDMKKVQASAKSTEGKANPVLTPDDNDLFPSPSLSKSEDKKVSQDAKTDDTVDDDIFGDSSLNKKKEQKKAEPAEIGDDIFATSTKDKKTKPKKAITKDEDLFDDDTDIFNDIPKAKPKEKKVKKKAAVPKKQIFKDDIDDIFADTSASTKPKEKKKTKKTTDTAKTEDKSKTLDDIFDDPLK